MKTKFYILAAIAAFLFSPFVSFGQFKNTNGTAFSYSTSLNGSDVFVTGRPGVANFNLASSNLFALAMAAGGKAATNAAISPVENSPIARNAYFVDASYGSDANAGTLSAPWATIGKACSNATVGATIFVCPGIYTQTLWRGGVIWDFSEGATITVTLSTYAVAATNGTNVVIRGRGIFKNTDSNGVIFKDENSSLEIEALGIQGNLDMYGRDAQNTKFVIRNCFIFGGIASAFDFGGSGLCEVSLVNCRVYSWNDGGAAWPYAMAGCISKSALTPNAFRVGDPVVNTNMDFNINLQ